jgi:hypothetical protein
MGSRAKPARRIITTDDFQQWAAGLTPERQARVAGAVAYIAAQGSTVGRPHVDTIHGSRLHKLKEARVGRGTRMLFAFDSNRDLVMLVGGDKTGKWNGWYPSNIDRAQELYLDHERSIGKEPRCLSQREARRTRVQRGR